MLLNNFVFDARSPRVVFGADSINQVRQETEALGRKRAIVLCTPSQRDLADRVVERLGGLAVAICDKAEMHVPIASVHAVLQAARACEADVAVAIGGGSTIGLAKALALDAQLPILAIPTTYAGSEMTPIYGITESGLKRTGRSERVLPKTVIYDPKLTLALPSSISVTSGINAIAHACEGLYAKDANPIVSLIAQEGIRAMAQALPRIVASGEDLQARAAAQYGAWLCGYVLGNVGMSLHHKLCHTLGGAFNLPHAETHTVVLPYAIAYNAPAAPEAMERIAQALACADAVAGLRALGRATGAPTTLRELGMKSDELDHAADLASQNPYWNPRPVERSGIRALLQCAYDGEFGAT